MVGIDLIENNRFNETNIVDLKKRILSDKEIKTFEEKTNLKSRIEYLASRFAGKEALYKCGYRRKNFNEISILNRVDGSPYIEVDGIILNYCISISHEKNYSIAIVIKNEDD